MPDLHVSIVSVGDIVATVPEAIDRLVGAAHLRHTERRQPLRHLSEQRDASCLQVEQSRRGDAADDDRERDGAVLHPHLAGDEECKRARSDQQGRRIRVADVQEEVVHPLPEVAAVRA